jgi:hypothetical protein
MLKHWFNLYVELTLESTMVNDVPPALNIKHLFILSTGFHLQYTFHIILWINNIYWVVFVVDIKCVSCV